MVRLAARQVFTAASAAAARFGRRAAAANRSRYAAGGMFVFAIGSGGVASTLLFPAVALAASPSPVADAKHAAASHGGDQLPVISLDEVRKHNTASSAWVTYNGDVYDVTGFLEKHPGGHGLLLTAAGLDLGHFFENYKVHTQSGKAQEYLAGMKIGRLSESDAKRARAATTPEVHVERRMAVLGDARRRMVAVLLTMPFWLALRTLIRIVGFILPPIAHFAASMLPVSVPGYGSARRLAPVDSKTGRRRRIAVIGGGIAGSGCAYALRKSGFDVVLYEARKTTSGNARTFDWDVKGKIVKSCVSVTAWPAILYKNYVALLKQIDVKTTPMHLSWFLNSRVPGHEGHLWAADPEPKEGTLRKHFAKDFDGYRRALSLIDKVTRFMTFQFADTEVSMYSANGGLGPLNPFATVPLYSVCRLFGVSRDWWDIVFTSHYTASFLTDKLDNMVAVTGPMIEKNIPLLPDDTNAKDCVITTCETWADAGHGLREVFSKLHRGVDVRVDTRVLKVQTEADQKMHVIDEHGGFETYDRVVFACPVNAVGNMLEKHNWIEDTVLGVPEYADDHHPATGHMHAVMHNDASVIPEKFRDDVLKRGSNYVEITRMKDGTLNIENTYNFGVQTPQMLGKPLSEKVPMLITHALGEGKSIDPALVKGEGNHARAHPLYSGWNLSAVLSMRLLQGRRGVFYCANYTTPGNCHDMSLLSGLIAAHAVGADYPFPENVEAKKDFGRLRGLMGV